MLGWLMAPLVLQGAAMLVDEGWFHRRRGLPKWERLGHPLDTLTVAATFGWALTRDPTSAAALPVYVALAAFSCLFVTKDEPIHARVCNAGECWLHAVLFILHPTVFVCFALLWRAGGHTAILTLQLVLTVLFGVYQLVYWSVLWKPRSLV